MTTIACDGKTIAADGRQVSGNCITMEDFQKVVEWDGIVYAFTGNASLFYPMMRWHKAGADVKECPQVGKDDGALIVFNSMGVTLYRTDCPYADRCATPDAWGTGATFAIGAMDAGADAVRAVELAMSRDPYSGGKVISFPMPKLG